MTEYGKDSLMRNILFDKDCKRNCALTLCQNGFMSEGIRDLILKRIDKHYAKEVALLEAVVTEEV